MEKFKTFLGSLRPWQTVLLGIAVIGLITSAVFASLYLRRTARIQLGSDAGLILTADRQDSLGTFSDSDFTLKSDTDLSAASVRDNIVFFPEIDFDIRQVSPRQFVIDPKDDLSDNSLYRVKVLTGQKTYSWAFQTKNDFRVVQTLPRDKSTAVPENSGIEISFSHDNWQDVQNFFEISPKVQGRFERHKRTVSFIPGSLSPETLYTVTLKKGIKLEGTDEVLKEDYVFKFETAVKTSGSGYLDFSSGTYEFSPSETPAFSIYTGQTDGSDLSVRVYQYPSEAKFSSDFQARLSIPAWAYNSTRNFRLPVGGLQKVSEFNTPIQKQSYSNYFTFPNTLPKGFYLVEASLGGGIGRQVLVQITDLSAYLSVSGSKTLVWVNDTGTGKSVPSAKVSLAGKETNTGEDGVAYFDTPGSQLSTEDGQTVTIRSGSQALLLPVSGRYYYSTDYLSQRRASDKYWSYLYLDRPVYLPGDTVRFWGLLRDRDNLNQKQKFTLEVTHSDYLSWDFTPVTLFSKDLETSDMGTFISEIPLKNFNPGYYNLNIKINDQIVLSSSIGIETYTKPAYRLDILPDRQAMIAGDTINISGQASFFEGSPVPQMQLVMQGAKVANLTTDSQGKFSFSYLADGEISPDYSPYYRYFTVRPFLPEEGQIQGDTSLAIFNSSLYFAAYKSTQSNNSAQITIDLRQVDVHNYVPGQTQDNFKSAPSVSITGYLQENIWNQREVGTYYDFINKVTSPRYEYFQTHNRLADISLTTDGSGKAIYNFPVENNKSYEAVFEVSDSAGRLTRQRVFIYGASANPMDNYVSLKTEKFSYSINEKVDMVVMRGQNPIEDTQTDRFLYLFAQRGIKSYKVLDSNVISFNFPEAYVPSVDVKAIRFSGKTYQVTENSTLRFDTVSKKLSLGVTQDKSSYKPGDTAKLNILTKDFLGSPVSAEVNLNLVDEAYYALYGALADPLMQIYKNLDPDILAQYSSHKYPDNVSGAEGGGCFLPGTKILMADGGSRNIEDIKVGDSIKTLQSPDSQKQVKAKVVEVFNHVVSGYLLINNHLRVTPEHNLYINGRWMTAGEVKIGDYYKNADGDYEKITSIDAFSGLFTVYNFTVAKQNTYFADGVYVHNQKGRDLFVDTAYFGTVKTGGDGKAAVDIKLPDNLTSWRITSQALTSALQVGSNTGNLNVRQPFFVDMVMSTEYLESDKPQIIVRAFGDALSSGDQVNLNIQSKSLGLEKSFTAAAYESVKVPLGNLTEGEHEITLSGSGKSQSDKITRKIKVLKSHLTITKSENVNISDGTALPGATDSQTTVVFSDQSTGRFYPALTSLSSVWGDRLDQRLARTLARQAIYNYFDKTVEPDKLDLSAFRTPKGGYAIYPYADADVELSAFVAALAADGIDRAGLANYLYRRFSEAKDIDTASISLFGLASLEEPVLLLIDNLADEKNLTPMSRIYLALAQAKIGDSEKALVSYRSLMSEFSQKQDLLTYMKIGRDKEDYLKATALVSALSSLLGDGEADNLLSYTLVNSARENLLVSAQMLSIMSRLNGIIPQPVSFSYTLDGKKTSVSLEKGETRKLILSPEQLSSITFSDIKGDVGATGIYSAPLDPATAKVSDSVTLSRTYSVEGLYTTRFADFDLVKVSLLFKHGEISQDGCYQVTDILPSGLRPIVQVYSYGVSTKNIWYPYEINGQKVSFCVGRDTKGDTINYYARVIGGGTYKAESALIQSLISPSVYNLTKSGEVAIR